MDDSETFKETPSKTLPQKSIKTRTASLNRSSIYKCTNDEKKIQSEENKQDLYKYLYGPHTVTILVLLLGVFAYLAVYSADTASTSTNTIRGLSFAAIFLIMFGITQFKDGPFIRPHPLVWRAVLVVSLIYLMMLVVLFFQRLDDARLFFKLIDSDLGVVLPEKSYAEDCSLTYSNIMSQVDVFVILHVVGWYVKALILRDQWLCWITSVMFEVLEYSLQHQLPNFAECWWDHWVLDVLLCNWIGIALGMATCRYLAMKTYQWRDIRHIESVSGKAWRTVTQFTPYNWMSFDWAATRTLRGYLVVILVTSLFLLSELNAFYLKYLLWIPVEHPINLVRLILYALMGSVTIREAYQFFSENASYRVPHARLGTQAWVTCAIVIMETLVCVKFGRNQFPNPIPQSVKIFWSIFTSFLFLFPVWNFYIRPRLITSMTIKKIK